MNKIRILFLVLVLIIFIISLAVFTRLQIPIEPQIEKISEFQITRISGNGAIYSDDKTVKRKSVSPTNVVDISEMYHADESYIKTDSQTSFEFYCFGTFFTVLPGSRVYFQPKTESLCFYDGEYFWNKEIKKKNSNVLLQVEGDTFGESQRMKLSLPDSGRLKITSDIIKIWNYSGNLKFNYDNQEFGLKSNQFLQVKNQKVEVLDILPAPEFITPEAKTIVVNKPGDSFLKFSWRSVRGANNYLVRFYSSELKENLLEEVMLSDTQKNINVLKFGLSQFFWQVFPYDTKTELEGSPSKIGNIEVIGSIGEDKFVLERPALVITSLSTSGNMVLIRGEADKECQLFINGKSVPINMDGTFYETLTYSSLGKKSISFRLVSPTEMETDITKTVTIFDE
jgi:hypothetical protein